MTEPAIVDVWFLEYSQDRTQVKIPEAQLRAAGWAPATENARLRGALVDLLTTCEENTCGKTAEAHCEWCAPGWAALR